MLIITNTYMLRFEFLCDSYRCNKELVSKLTEKSSDIDSNKSATVNQILASLSSIDEFSEFVENKTEAVIWTDFERINQTHFWSPHKKIYINPPISTGNRKSLLW